VPEQGLLDAVKRRKEAEAAEASSLATMLGINWSHYSAPSLQGALESYRSAVIVAERARTAEVLWLEHESRAVAG